MSCKGERLIMFRYLNNIMKIKRIVYFESKLSIG